MARTLGIPKETCAWSRPLSAAASAASCSCAPMRCWPRSARALAGPVKVALQRPLMINNTTHRPATIQRIRIGAGRDGKITAIAHESWSGDLPGGSRRPRSTRRAAVRRRQPLTALRLAVLDLPEGNAMRAPGEAPGMMALEIAMDEMAEKLKMDPVSSASSTTPRSIPKSRTPFSQRRLVECLRLGAERFGWNRRMARPGRCATAAGWSAWAWRGLPQQPHMKSARACGWTTDGKVTVETDMTDIGTGTYTIIAQTAAEMMGVPLEKVVVRLGDSAFPVSCRLGRAVGRQQLHRRRVRGLHEAARGRRAKRRHGSGRRGLCRRHGARRRPLHAARPGGRRQGPGGRRLHGVRRPRQKIPAVDLRRALCRSRRRRRHRRDPRAAHAGRLRRGRILNPKSARSQVIGAMTMGVGAALMEELVVDKRLGFFVNHDLAGYEVPVHADIPHQEVIFLDETDPMSSPMKAKGVGELGICGVGRLLRMRSTTRPGCGFATIRSRWTSCVRSCRPLLVCFPVACKARRLP
jgi:xanthine dehydrogenase YagR molybdenum-binding subunit